MRKNKFRAWFKKDQEMKEVAMNNVYTGNKSYLHLSPLPMSDYKEIDLMQWTGLKDKNGKEIYEGDIVKFHYKRGIYKIGPVVWNDMFGSWSIDCADFVAYKSLGEFNSVSEVIGNIYEHSHLL